MNERIRELREQAWALVSDEERDRGELYETRVRWERCDQKFAELIVRECGAVAYKAYWKNPETVRGRHIEEKIREHFGVE